MRKINVLIADDHETVRRGLNIFLKTFADIEVTGEAENGLEIIRHCAATQPDLILMDLMMPEMDGIAATRHIHKNYPHIRVVGLTSTQDENQIEKMLAAGAFACLDKSAAPTEIMRVILNAAASRYVQAH